MSWTWEQSPDDTSEETTNYDFIIEAIDGGWSTALEILKLPIGTLSEVIRSLGGISPFKEHEYLEAMAGDDEVRRMFATQELLVEIITQQQRILENDYQRMASGTKSERDGHNDHRTQQILCRLDEQRNQVLEKIKQAIEAVQRA